jgi:peptidoglycan/xylan/chitin deacetylase (PgdA/CDA1 family)
VRAGRVGAAIREWRRPTSVLGVTLALVIVAGGAWAGLRTTHGLSLEPAAAPPPHTQALASVPRIEVPEATAPGPGAVIPRGRPSVRVPILEYHYVRVNPNPRDQLGFNLSVTPANLAAQMDWLAARGYHSIDIADLRAYFAGQVDLPPRPVVLTFDDGYEDFYTAAWPVLRRHRFKAVSYVVPGLLGSRAYMTPAQVHELDRAGVEIGSHSVHHVDLTRVDQETLDIELQASRGYLENLLDHPVLDFCYPSGKFNARVEAAVAASGYQSATSELPGTAHGEADRLAWTRVRVPGGEQLPDFAASLGPSDPTQVVAAPVLPAPAPTRAPPSRSGHGAVP